MALINNGYARTQYAGDPWWFRWCAKWLGSRKSTFPTDVDLIRFRLVKGVIIFALIESKCLRGRRMKTHQQKTFQMLDQLLFDALNYRDIPVITFKAKGKTYSYPVKYGGFFVCNSYACDEVCDDLMDVEEDPTTDDTGILLGSDAHTAKLDFLLRTVDTKDRKCCNWLMLVRRFRGEEVDIKTAFILRLIEAVIEHGGRSGIAKRLGGQHMVTTHQITGVSRVDRVNFHGLHLLEYDYKELDRANFWWDGKPSDLRTVVEKMTFGKITDAKPLPPLRPVMSIDD